MRFCGYIASATTTKIIALRGFQVAIAYALPWCIPTTLWMADRTSVVDIGLCAAPSRRKPKK
ncbi:uncharacterized protein CANTADRAFT_27262 [Suhomyces tanzawaensis NRRL Y-17324]|uniref:Uncharacterized protein n=1 Tax=Suhomyces tanzawaensis NRRL Y-17324 TaxID=984487 RepID=A0A1E4SDH6_9ASCO|nr:uncharacterized protein CANTADRAFT_27262 [Suhomyces tanzawaensis NRRL Y-17324]ODV77442.1 hypothetical protein CANTADRAFT_97104 [Suhomyces tanzawaensis NRRL Y-17324]